MQCLGIFRRDRSVGFHDLEYKEVVAIDQAAICELALQIGVALADQRCGHLLGGVGGQPEVRELVDRGA
jgi:hypothetical protein